MNIQQLLDKFYEGVSTPEEECMLKDYFLKTEKVDKQWEADQKLFQLLANESIKIPEEFSNRLSKSIDQMSSIPISKSHFRKRTLLTWISTCAAILIIGVASFFAINHASEPELTDTFNNPEEAALVASETLAYVSSQMNKGFNQVNDAQKEINKASKILNKHFK